MKKQIKTSLLWLAFWVGAALLFNAGIWYFQGKEKALEFFGGYIIEQSLSIDNLFLFLLVFASFGLEPRYQRRVLTYGIIGAIILRLIFVVVGVAVVNQFHFMLYIFGFILILSGLHMMFGHDKEKDFRNNRFLKFASKIIPFTDELHGEKFFIRNAGKLVATPLFAVLLVIEFSDVIFAIDSIPAIFSITTDPFIVYTSNIFAILGLRNLYFLLEQLHHAFAYVKYGVALILVFTGVKLAGGIVGLHIPVVLSISIIFGILILSVVISALFAPKAEKTTVTE